MSSSKDHPQQQRIRGLEGWRRTHLRGCGDGKDPRREQGAGDPMIGTMIGVEGVREGRTGAAEWIKKNQSGFEIFFEAL